MTFGPYLSGYFDVGAQLPAYLRSAAETCFERERAEKAAIQTREQFERRRERIKKHFLEAIGGLDFPESPLDVQYTGTLEANGYSIRKMIFKSVPGVYVTANLYVPHHLDGKAPAVLFACGHDEAAKASATYQKVCIDLARQGFVALAVDPISQGERMQYYDLTAGRSVVRWHCEHTYINLQCHLTGSSVARYFIRDLSRAMDVLCELPFVDADKIGITGNSGGGLQTMFMMLFEDRLAAAAPCTYVTSRESYMGTGQSQDGEQILFGAIAEGINFDDYVASFAPRPAMIGAVKSDFFNVEGVYQALERTKQIYRLYDSESNVRLGLVDGTHAFNDELRQETVRFFNESLRGIHTEFVTDPNIPVVTPKELQCTGTGQVLAEFDDARPLSEYHVLYWEANRPVKARSREDTKREVLKWLQLPEKRDPIHPRIIFSNRISSGSLLMPELIHDGVFFFSEKDIAVAGIYVDFPKRESERCTVLILDEGANDVKKENDLVNTLLKDGSVFAFDPRGWGVVQSRAISGRPFDEMFGTEYKLQSDANMLKRPIGAMRVFDVLRACDYIHTRLPGCKFRLAGKGFSSIYAMLVGIARDDVDEIYMENGPDSLESIIRSRYYHYDARLDLYGLLKAGDIPDWIKAFPDKRVSSYQTPDVGKTMRW